MKNLLIGGAAAAALIAVVPAVAQVAPAAAPTPKADREHTRAEVQAKVAEHFAKIDANRDGAITREEAEAGRAAMRERWQQQGIGHAMAAKRAGGEGMAFDRLDADKDGSISRAEWDAARAQRAERMAEHRAGKAGAPKAMRIHRMGGAGALHGRMFEIADADKDGRVTLAEAQAAALRHFDMADANRDGRVTREERRQIHRQMIEKKAPTAG